MRAPGPRRPCRACVLLNHRKEKRAEPRASKISTPAADPAIGWTSPLPAVRMRAAMLVSAVVATCRGRRRRGAIREDVCWLLTSRTDGVGFRTLSTRLSQIGTSSNAAARNKCDAFLALAAGSTSVGLIAMRCSYRSEAATARARSVVRACGFQTAGRSGSRACSSEIKGSPTRATPRRDDASVAHAIAPTLTPHTSSRTHR